MDYPSRTAYSTRNNLFIGILLPFDTDLRVEAHGAEPVISIIHRAWRRMHCNSFDIGKQLLVHFLHMLMMFEMVVDYGHLSAADTGTDITHAVVIADSLVLVIGISLTGLGGIPHDFISGLFVGADQSTTATGGNHLVAIEREDTVLTKGTQHLAIESRAKSLSCIFDDRNTILLPYFHDTLDVVRHTIQRDRDDGFGQTASLGLSVKDCLLQ